MLDKWLIETDANGILQTGNDLTTQSEREESESKAPRVKEVNDKRF